MDRRIVLILAGFLFAASGAFAQEGVTPTGEGVAAPELKALADSCSAHKFETLVVVDGSGHGKKVRICGKPGQSDAEWLVTLTDSTKKVEADEAMAQPIKDQIIAALKTEISRLESGAPAPVAMPVATIALPAAPVAVPEAVPQYSKVPPMPAAKPRAAGSIANTASVPIAPPRITIRCALPREAFAGCAGLVRETQLLIRADENLAPGASLRFLRGGDARADLDLGPLKKGESLREKLPGRVCSGVLRGKVEVQVLRKNQVTETLGPYALYCGS